MIQYQNLLSEIEEFIDEDLPPRATDPMVIASVLVKKPVKIKYGFCGMCDSRMINNWAFELDGSFYDLFHLMDRKILRRSEYRILEKSLESGELKNEVFLARRVKDFFTKLFCYFAN